MHELLIATQQVFPSLTIDAACVSLRFTQLPQRLATQKTHKANKNDKALSDDDVISSTCAVKNVTSFTEIIRSNERLPKSDAEREI